MLYRVFILFLFLGFHSFIGFCQPGESLKSPKYQRVSQAYGYLVGQDHSLDLIKNSYPQYELSVLQARMTFQSTFGRAKDGMKKYLIDFMGPAEFIQFEQRLMEELKRLLGEQRFDHDMAVAFLTEVESRARGNVASPVLETLLSFQFLERPQEEVMSGFFNTYKTKGHPKSKDTNWQIKVPKSWKAEEADRPNIIQKFTSDFGAGKQSIMLMVNDMPLPSNYKPTRQELDEFFTEREMREIVPDGSRFIAFTKMTLDNNVGGMIEFEQISEQLDLRITVRMVQFMFLKGSKMYFLQGTVASEKAGQDLSGDMRKYMPLFKYVANSIVLLDQYK